MNGIRFDEQTLYSISELETALNGIMSVETFLHGLGIPRTFKNAVLGVVIVRAMEMAAEHANMPEKGRKMVSRVVPIGTGKRGRPKKISPVFKAIQLSEVLDVRDGKPDAL